MVTDCPTCGTPLLPAEGPAPCDALHPALSADVVPTRCVLDEGHRGMHRAAPVWPGTPALQWPPYA